MLITHGTSNFVWAMWPATLTPEQVFYINTRTLHCYLPHVLRCYVDIHVSSVGVGKILNALKSKYKNSTHLGNCMFCYPEQKYAHIKLEPSNPTLPKITTKSPKDHWRPSIHTREQVDICTTGYLLWAFLSYHIQDGTYDNPQWSLTFEHPNLISSSLRMFVSDSSRLTGWTTQTHFRTISGADGCLCFKSFIFHVHHIFESYCFTLKGFLASVFMFAPVFLLFPVLSLIEVVPS